MEPRLSRALKYQPWSVNPSGDLKKMSSGRKSFARGLSTCSFWGWKKSEVHPVVSKNRTMSTVQTIFRPDDNRIKIPRANGCTPLPSSLFPLPSSLFPLPSSLFPLPSSLFPLEQSFHYVHS